MITPDGSNASFIAPLPEDERAARLEAVNRRVNEQKKHLRERLTELAFNKEMARIEEDY